MMDEDGGKGEAEQMNIEYRGVPLRNGTLGMRRKRKSEEKDQGTTNVMQ